MSALKNLAAKLPPREQIFFVAVLAFVAYIAFATPHTVPNIPDLKREVFADSKVIGSASPADVEKWVEASQVPPAAVTLTDADESRNKLTSWFTASTAPAALARKTPFRPDSERYETLPPATISAPDPVPLIAFDPPVGASPEIECLARPVPRPPQRPVSMEKTVAKPNF